MGHDSGQHKTCFTKKALACLTIAHHLASGTLRIGFEAKGLATLRQAAIAIPHQGTVPFSTTVLLAVLTVAGGNLPPHVLCRTNFRNHYLAVPTPEPPFCCLRLKCFHKPTIPLPNVSSKATKEMHVNVLWTKFDQGQSQRVCSLRGQFRRKGRHGGQER